MPRTVHAQAKRPTVLPPRIITSAAACNDINVISGLYQVTIALYMCDTDIGRYLVASRVDGPYGSYLNHNWTFNSIVSGEEIPDFPDQFTSYIILR